MIAKGNLHADGAGLARYLMTGQDGEIAHLLETRGLESFGSDPVQAFALLQQLAEENTKCQMPFFHAQTRLAPGERLTDEQWLHVADREEKRLGFTGQPRIVSFHLDPATGDKHLHVGWCRIDLEHMRAIDPGMFKNHLKQLSRTLEKEFALREVSSQRKPEDRARIADRDEVEESRRLGTDVRAIRTAILECLEQSDGGKAFNAALEARGLMLANGDKRDCFVVIDAEGGQHALNKKLTGQTLKATRERLADLDRSQLPGVDQAQQLQAEIARRQVEPIAGAERTGPAPEAVQEARAAAARRYDAIRDTERDVSRERFNRYADLDHPDPPRDIEREFRSAANRATEPAAPVYDRDAADAEWMDKLAEAAIARDAAKAPQEPPQAPEAVAAADAPAAARGSAGEAEIDVAAAVEQAPAAPRELRAADQVASGIFNRLAKVAEVIGGLIFGGAMAGPKPTRQQAKDRAQAAGNIETLHAEAVAAQMRAAEAEYDDRHHAQKTADQQQDLSFAARYGTPPTREANLGRDRDDDRERERER